MNSNWTILGLLGTLAVAGCSSETNVASSHAGGSAGQAAPGGNAGEPGEPSEGGSDTSSGGADTSGGSNNAGGDQTGGEAAGGENAGGADTGGENAGGAGTGAGGENAGGESAGGTNTGGANTGGAGTGGENTGGENAGGENAGGENVGGADTGGVGGADVEGGAGGAGDGGAGGAPPVGRCDPSAPFGSPVLATGIDGGMWVRLSADELTAHFVVGGTHLGNSGDARIYRASRASTDAVWSNVQAVDTGDLDAYGGMAAPTVSPDGNYAYYGTRQESGGTWSMGIRFGTWSGSSFGNRDMVVGLSNVSDHESEPYLLSDGNTMYFFAQRPRTGGDGDWDDPGEIRRAVRTGIGAVSSEVSFGNLVGRAPAVTNDQRILYLAIREAADGPYKIARSELDGPSWGDPVVVAELENTSGSAPDHFPTWISDDDCVLYLDIDGNAHVAVRPQ